MIKLVDIESYVQHGVQFGTCELCMDELRERYFKEPKCYYY